jgi:HK97 family phage portal protein
VGLFRRRDPVENAERALAGLDDEQRANLFQNSSKPPTWAEVSGNRGTSNVPVTLDTALSIPAVSSAVRLLSETISMLPLNVYRGRNEDKRLADATWQYRLLTELPGMGDFTAMDLVSDIVACIEWEGNAFLLKVKTPPSVSNPEVMALIVIDPTKVRIERKNGEKRFLIRGDDGKEKPYTASDILHIRGWTPSGGDRGMSPMMMHKDKIGAVLAQQYFQGKFFGNGLLKNFGIEVPNKLDEQGAQRLDQAIRNQLGISNAFYPIVAQGGAKIVPTGMSLSEAQYVEGDRQNMIQVAHMFRIPPSFLVPDAIRSDTNFEQDNLRYYTLGVAPRLKRIELALFTDPDLFPQRVIYPEFDTAKLLRTDAKTQAEVDHFQIQDGTKMRDEIRARDGLSPLPNGAGKIVPETPAGAGGPAGQTKQPAQEPQGQQDDQAVNA